jgi:feruloyl esterase
VPPEDTIGYYEALANASGGFAETQKFFPVLPGTWDGATAAVALAPAVSMPSARWSSGSRKVSHPCASSPHTRPAGRVDRTRPLCPYPQMATYKGTGSIDDAANFTCAVPK